MHMQNLSSMGVLDTPALMQRFVIAVDKDKGFQHAKGLIRKLLCI